jgi:2-amino-4-hydroxy-6-hydroxymethyldihydropteridine diphosphokinase
MGPSVGYVALGSNLGDRRAYLELALAHMVEMGIAPERRSSVWETEPVETLETTWFLNMVVRIRSSLRPMAVLNTLLEIERKAGRVRNARRNASRTIDLDLLVLGTARVSDPRLTLPHPRMWERRFVLAPLAEIDPDFRHPETGKSVREALDELDGGDGIRRLGGIAALAERPL